MNASARQNTHPPEYTSKFAPFRRKSGVCRKSRYRYGRTNGNVSWSSPLDIWFIVLYPDFHGQSPPSSPRRLLFTVKVLGSLHLILWKCPKFFFLIWGHFPTKRWSPNRPFWRLLKNTKSIISPHWQLFPAIRVAEKETNMAKVVPKWWERMA